MKKNYFFTLLITAFTFVFSFGQNTTVFINEIHYDNADSDVAEGFEIAGPAGTDLSTYVVTKYNGGNSLSYGDVNLTGTIQDQSNGYGTVWFELPPNGLQNGPSEGLALSNNGVLIQFLSYEGQLTAEDGVATGVTSTDIGVSESSSTAVGESLQLVGTGTIYENFTWSGPITSTSNAINTGQTFEAVVDPTLSVSLNSVTGLGYVSGNTSLVSESFSVSGLNLTEDVSISVPQGFEASEDDITFSTDDIVLAASNGSVSTTEIYVKLSSGQQEDAYSGTLTISSTGLSESVTLSGQVYADPFVQNLSQDLFFSEYSEGSSNNKYLEIYNPTDQTVDLSTYAIASVSNDPTIVGWHEYFNTFNTGATIAPGETYVWANSSSDQTILNAVAISGETGTAYFNGDDGYALAKGTSESYVILDIIGDFNGDPGNGWSVAGVADATKDKTLVRKSSVTQGNNDFTASAGTTTENSEWIVYDQNTWTYIGTHTFSIFDFADQIIKVYPNPVSSNLNFSGLSSAVQVSVYDMTGRLHMQKEIKNTLDMSSLKGGIYMVKIENESGSKVFNVLKN